MSKALNKAKLNIQVSLDHQFTMDKIRLYGETVEVIRQLQTLLIGLTYSCGK